MKRLYLFLIILFSLFQGYDAYAQFPDLQEDENYEKEWAFGILMNTHGGLIGGVSVRHARKLFFTRTIKESLGVNSGKEKVTVLKEGYLENPNMYHSFSFEIINIKHPKEQRIQSPQTGNSYVPAKRNYLLVIRPQYGRELILFRKAREQGVQINFVGAVGPAIGLVAPYLIRYRDTDRNRTVVEQYDSQIHTNTQRIEGTGSFLEAIGKSNVQLGLALKASLTFEFGISKRNISGVEAGAMLDAFTKEIEILQGADNKAIYPSLFLTFFFGSRK
ncbi:hypothetical protein V6R21_26945 [Limibacter armeniacum]|uniref:hypothetical protein n=1 Tax=Limibacter armeniacum TaxID=466084 RepID=UPI002FE55B79